MSVENFLIPLHDGPGLAAWRLLPAGRPRAIVQLTHGMAEHSARYEPLARRLVAAGFAVYSHDHPGHGRSVQPSQPPGHMGLWDRAVDGVWRLSRRAVEDLGELPFVLMGHSMGSFMVQQLMAREHEAWSAVVLSGSNGPPAPLAKVGQLIARAERARLGEAGTSMLIHNMAFGGFNKPFEPARTPFEWLSRDPAQVDLYIADPLCGFPCTVGTWQGLLDALPRLTAPAALARVRKDLPVYVFSGDRDPVGDMGRGVQKLHACYQRAGLRRVSVKLYPEGRHEMLNEVNREQVTADLLGWLDQALAGG